MTGDAGRPPFDGLDPASRARAYPGAHPDEYRGDCPGMLVSIDATAPTRGPVPERASTALATLVLPAPSGDDAAWALSVIEAVELLKARLDLAALQAWRVLHAAYERASSGFLDTRSDPATARERDRAETTAACGTVDEVMTATGLGEAECRRRLSFALSDPQRVATLIRSLERGELSLTQACWLHEDTSSLGPADADSALAAALRTSRDGIRPSAALVRRRLARELVRRADPTSVQRRARCAHDAGGQLQPDGNGSFWITGDAARVAAADARVDRLARGIQAAGGCPDRTLAQLRSDVALDLLLRGDPHEVPGRTSPHAELEPPAVDWTRLGELPPARVRVVVPLSVLLGATGVGELPGHGWIDGEHVRELAFAPGSIWERLVTDPVTGGLIERSPGRYLPSVALRDHVVTRDGVCRFPGCTVDAARSDLDHDVPWPHGPTTAANLTAKHRRHHQLKTAGFWSAHHSADHTLTWTSLAGRHYVTVPRDYRDLDPPG